MSQLLITPAEYLALERRSRERSDCVNGRVYARPGSSRLHNLIVGNILVELRTQLRGRPCEACVSDMRAKVQRTGM